MKNVYFIGIDIGGTKMSGAIVKDNGNILSEGKLPTPRRADGKEIYRILLKLIKEIMASAGVELGEIHGIGLGVPGIVDSTGEKILATPNINLAGFPLYHLLHQELNKPIAIGNDVNLGLLGEKWLGCGRKFDNIVGLFPGTGIGGAIIINGRLYAGAFGGAGELGHMIIEKDGPLCSCKNRGCLEALASRWAMERDLKDAINKGRKTVLRLTHRKGEQIKSNTLNDALKVKDKLVVSVMTKASETLGHACVSLRHIFDPQMIILGGGIIKACGDFMLPKIRKVVEEDPFFAHLPSCEIMASDLGDEAVILGAVALVKDKLMYHAENTGISYPDFYYKKPTQILMKDDLVKDNMYVRSDGFPKDMKSKLDFDEFKMSHLLNLAAVKRVCKKNPRFFIIGTHSKRLALTEEAKEYLIKKTIKVQILPIKEAISVYNALPYEKAFLLHLKN